MPIHVEWHDEEKKVLIRTVEGHWTWDEWYTARDEVESMMATVNHPVAIVIDFTGSRGMPPKAIGQFTTLMSNPPDNLDITVMVGMNRMIQRIYDVGEKIYSNLAEKRRITLVPSMDEAHALIEERLKQREDPADNDPI